MKKIKVMISFQEGHTASGPYQSHLRIMTLLKDLYDFAPLYIPRGRIGIYNPQLIRNLTKQIQRFNPDIIHIHGLQLAGYQLTKAAKKTNKPIVLAVRGSVNEAIRFPWWKRKLVQMAEKYTIVNATVVYGVSEYVTNWRILEKHAQKIYGTVYNLPSTISYKSTLNKRDELNIKSDEIVFVSTGRITKEKGFDILCNAILTLNNKKCKFIIVGDGEYKDAFAAKIIDAGFQDQVIFTGIQHEVMPYLQAANIFIICTKHETLCNSIIEAAHVGLPVIASRVGGIPEIVEDGFTGYLFDLNSQHELISHMNTLISNANKREKMGENGKKLIENKLGEENIASHICNIYNMVTDNENLYS